MSQFFDTSMVVLPDDLSTLLFKVLFGISQISGGLMIILATIWMELYDNNGIWTGLHFRFHPVLMAFAIYLLGNALLIFRVLRARKKWIATVVHAIVHSCAIFVMCLAAFIVWTTYVSIDEATTSITKPHVFNGPQPFLRYYSFHTWLGLGTITLYIVQYLGGIIIYIHPDTETRRAVMPFHQLMGVIVFGATILTACFGTSQQASWKSICSGHGEIGQHIISNIFAMSFIVFSASVLILVCNPRWKRGETSSASFEDTAPMNLVGVPAVENHAQFKVSKVARFGGIGNLGRM